MDLNSYVEKYNQDFYLNTEKKDCLCGSSKEKKLFDLDRYLLKNRVVTCKNCGLIFTNPMLKKSFLQDFYQSDIYRKLYNHQLNENIDNIFLNEGDGSINAFNFLEKFVSHKKKELNIIEIGSGNNSNLVHFKSVGNLYAIDYSEESKKLSAKQDIIFEQGGVEVLKKLNIKFDIIILSHVIEHFHDFRNDMLEIRKFSNENSLFYIEVPSMDLKYNLDQLQNAHNFYFTKNSFLYHLNKLGLNSLEYGVASKIHQYGIFKNGKISPYSQNVDEYKRIIKIHRNFCYNFYFVYLLNLYLRKFIKKLVGKNMTNFIRSSLKKIRK